VNRDIYLVNLFLICYELVKSFSMPLYCGHGSKHMLMVWLMEVLLGCQVECQDHRPC